MLVAFIYMFTSLTYFSSYPVRQVLSPGYRQGVARLKISFSKNILMVISGRDRVGQELDLSSYVLFTLWPGSCRFSLSQSSCSLTFKPSPYSLPLLAVLCPLLPNSAPALKYLKILSSFTHPVHLIFSYIRVHSFINICTSLLFLPLLWRVFHA